MNLPSLSRPCALAALHARRRTVAPRFALAQGARAVDRVVVRRRTCGQAFSLIELVIVVVIIGTIAAIAIPRMSRGTAAAVDSGLANNLTLLRKAVELYRAEHGTYPTCDALGGNRTTIMVQLTQYTDVAGNTSSTRTAVHRFGPYLKAIPKLGVTERRDRDRINTSDGGSVAWIYEPASGAIRANAPANAADAAGRLYNDY